MAKKLRNEINSSSAHKIKLANDGKMPKDFFKVREEKNYAKECIALVTRDRVDAAASKIGDSILLDPSLDITPLFNMVMDGIKSEIDVKLLED